MDESNLSTFRKGASSLPKILCSLVSFSTCRIAVESVPALVSQFVGDAQNFRRAFPGLAPDLQYKYSVDGHPLLSVQQYTKASTSRTHLSSQMPPTRTNALPLRDEPRMQTPDPLILTAHFLRQIEASHVHTPTQGRPIPLHYCATTQSLAEWAWPCNLATERRYPPSELEGLRRTHRFRAPSCLCALLEQSNYTEARIGIVETATSDAFRNQSLLHGEYVATCARQRCGYFLCLERFYPLNHLRLQPCRPRRQPLASQDVATITDIDKSLRSGDGLFQLMTDVVVRGPGGRLEQVHPDVAKKAQDSLMEEIGEGMTEQRFWATFVQCFLCKKVTLRKHFVVGHTCLAKNGRSHPYARHGFETSRTESEDSDDHNYMVSSPAPTEIVETEDEYDIFEDVEYVFVHQGGSADVSALGADNQTTLQEATTEGDADIPSVISSDVELPTIQEIMDRVSQRRHINDA
ncbi:hypothetical protein NMY22_g10069 [Coprinellus aureogranulatus]|nr:hypothetical protein NMY22_g10069 [Coprinellus aureogranulatus]